MQKSFAILYLNLLCYCPPLLHLKIQQLLQLWHIQSNPLSHQFNTTIILKPMKLATHCFARQPCSSRQVVMSNMNDYSLARFCVRKVAKSSRLNKQLINKPMRRRATCGKR